VKADYYIAALPVEIMATLVTDKLKSADPQLGRLAQLQTAWMSGIQFYLARDVPLVHGHTLYIDSEWALTSISQGQFWPGFPPGKFGDGQVGGIISVDISDWETKGLGGKKAIECQTDQEIMEEVWAQLQAHLNDQGENVLDDANRVGWFLDPDIVFPNPEEVPANLEPLLINTAGSWAFRPEARTALPNFFLAGDYVRTHTDLATMEGANESARRAVNALLEACDSAARRCMVWPLREPWVFAPLRWYDRWRFRRGKPHNPNLIRFALAFFVPLWHLLHLLWSALEWFRGKFPRRGSGRKPDGLEVSIPPGLPRDARRRQRLRAKARRVKGGHAAGVPDTLSLHPAGSLGHPYARGRRGAPDPAGTAQELGAPIPGRGRE
jgi:hypothetical protein